MQRRLRVGVTWGWNNAVQCMADPASPICLADGRTFERFALSQVENQIDLVDLTTLGYGVYSNGSFILFLFYLLIQGTFNGDLGKVIDGTVDTIMDTYVLTAEMSRFFDLTVPFIKPSLAFLTATKPVRIASLYKLFGAFNWRVWILVAIALCVLSFAVRLAHLLFTKWKANRGKIQRSEVIHALTVDTEKRDNIRPSTVTQTILILLYILAVTTFTAAYQGAQLQTLMVDDAYIYSVDEVIQQISSGERQLIVDSIGYYFTDEIEHAREMNNSNDMTIFARLARATEKNPIIVNKNGTEVLDGVAKNKYIFMHMIHWMEDTLKIANYRTYEGCDIFDLININDGNDHWLGLLLLIYLLTIIY